MAYRCANCGSAKAPNERGNCTNCGEPMPPPAPEAPAAPPPDAPPPKADIDAMLGLIRDAWRDGEPNALAVERLKRERERLGIPQELFEALDLYVRKDFGVMDSDAEIALEIRDNLEAVIGYQLSPTFSIRNTHGIDLDNVRIDIQCSCLEQVANANQKNDFPLPAGEEKTIILEYWPKAANLEAPLKVIVETRHGHGVVRKYRLVDFIGLPIFASVSDKVAAGQSQTKLVINGTSGGVAAADCQGVDPGIFREIQVLASEGGSAGFYTDLQEKYHEIRRQSTSLRVKRQQTNLVPLLLRLDIEKTLAHEEPAAAAPRETPPVRDPSSLCDRLAIFVQEEGEERRLQFVAKEEIVFGALRPGSTADVRMAVWDEQTARIDKTRTGGISGSHFTVSLAGGRPHIRDGAEKRSTHGTRRNRADLGDTLVALANQDIIEIAKGLLSLRALLDFDDDNRLVNARFVAVGGGRHEEYVLFGSHLDVGSAGECGLRLATASELNARIFRADGAFWIRNLDSLDNVAVDGVPLALNAVAPLRPGGCIAVGRAAFTIDEQ